MHTYKLVEWSGNIVANDPRLTAKDLELISPCVFKYKHDDQSKPKDRGSKIKGSL